MWAEAQAGRLGCIPVGVWKALTQMEAHANRSEALACVCVPLVSYSWKPTEAPPDGSPTSSNGQETWVPAKYGGCVFSESYPNPLLSEGHSKAPKGPCVGELTPVGWPCDAGWA